MNLKSKIGIGIFTIFTLLVSAIPELDYLGKLSLIIFVLALGLFIFTKLPAGLAAWLVLVIGVLLGLPENIMFNAFTHDVVWLMIGAFIIAGVLYESGLINRLSQWVINNCTTKGKVTFFTFIVIMILSVIVPSTSARASVMLPLYEILTDRFNQHQKFFSLAIPVLIIMAANTTLLGAGSHLVGISILQAQTGESISYIEFLIYAFPFGLIISYITYVIIKWLYFKDFNYTIKTKDVEKMPFTTKEKLTFCLVVITILLWLCEPIHGFDIAYVTMLMSLIMMLPQLNLITWKKGLSSVSWSLIFFVAGATTLGSLLVEYGVTTYFQEVLLKGFNQFDSMNVFLVLLFVVLISVISHLLIPSHTTRAAVLIPVLLIIAETFNVNPVAMVFISLIGINFCVTLPVSSKALLIFYEGTKDSFTSKDLFKLSMILMPIYVVLMIVTYYIYWQHLGLKFF